MFAAGIDDVYKQILFLRIIVFVHAVDAGLLFVVVAGFQPCRLTDCGNLLNE